MQARVRGILCYHSGMANIEIIKLTPDEWPLYKEIRLDALLRAPEAFSSRYDDGVKSPDTYWQGRLRDTLAGDKSWLLFARVQGRLVGLIGAFRSEAGDTVDIISVYVVPEMRSMGVGRLLMEAILAEVGRVPGVKKAKLGVNADQAPAVALYKRMGFRVIGELSGVMGDDQNHLEYMMEKSLESS
jgi:ribosomal protein S18 acetylase RimI-like enzyme